MSEQTAELAETPKTAADPLTVAKRLQKEGRWAEIEPVRDQMMREARKGGMLKDAAQQWVYGELDRMYPPLPPPEPEQTSEPETSPEPETQPSDAVVGDSASTPEPAIEAAPVPDPETDDSHARTREGLGRLPRSWPPLADNAQLPVELGWVQANRLRVVEERQNGEPIIRLKRAGSPAPSWAALGWLDTAIRNPAKWADICARGMAQQELESDLVKRERRSIEDVRSLLSDMHK